MERSDKYLILDVLKGMITELMILVNTPGNWQYVTHLCVIPNGTAARG